MTRDTKLVATLTAEIEKLFEPVARAVRRGDESQIQRALSELRAIWKRFADSEGQDEIRARGMTFALEAVLGFALARVAADARRTLVESRKHALPMLQALGQRLNPVQEKDSVDGSMMSFRELADVVGAKPQNISDLLGAMSE